MLDAKSYKAVRATFDSLPDDVRKFFFRLDGLLINGNSFDLALAYLFMKLEEGHHRALKCGLVKIHMCDSNKADEALSAQHFTRSSYQEISKAVLGKDAPKKAIENLNRAESVRDKMIHGKNPNAAEQREAVMAALNYISDYGDFVKSRAKRNPFGDLRGLVGKQSTLNATTSYWIMKGLGFSMKGVSPVEVNDE